MDKLILSALVGFGLYLTVISTCSSKIKVEKLINNENLLESSQAPAQLGGQTWSTESIGWIENSRLNRNYNKYPPCFKLSKEAREIYDRLENKQLSKENLILTHKVLFEVMSMILCQYTFLLSKMCVNTMIEDRIRDLDALGYVRYDNRYRPKLSKLVGKYYDTASQASLEFLLRGLTLIEDELTKLSYKINENELNQIKILISRFTSQFFVLVAKDCK